MWAMMINLEISLHGLNVRNSYTMPTRAVWDLLPEPEGEGNKSHVARGGVV